MTNAATLRRQFGRQKGECTWCGTLVGKGRRTWCSDKCIEAYRLEHQWPYIRSRVHERDKGICALCGCDADKMKRLRKLVRRREGWESYRHLTEYWYRMGFDRGPNDYWQADHILPRIRGGTNELTNLRTLCVPCHKQETARLAADRATKRKDAARSQPQLRRRRK